MLRFLTQFVVRAAIVAVIAGPLQAATYFVPTDAALVEQADDIVVATGVTSLVETNARGAIVTRYVLRIEEVLKGKRNAGGHLVLTERGGRLGNRAKLIPGTPEYHPGERYLVFTGTNADLEPVTSGMALGQFRFEGALILREEIAGFDRNLEPHRERPRLAAPFLAYVRAVATRAPLPEADYFADAEPPRFRSAAQWDVAAQLYSRGSYLLEGEGGIPVRWYHPATTMVKSGVPRGADPDVAVTRGIAEWNGTDSDIVYTDGGRDDTAVGGLEVEDGKDAILFGDPNDEVGGAAGVGGITSYSPVPYDLEGEQFLPVNEVDVVLSKQHWAQNCLNTVVTHEIGHTLGFRHSNQGPAGSDLTPNALMNATVQCGWDGLLKLWDEEAAATVYGDGPVCRPIAIGTHPASRTMTAGSSVTLKVSASGSGPVLYRWYAGVRGSTANPVGTNAATFTTGPLSPGTHQHWVRVTNDCGSADSNTSTLIVHAPCSAGPSIVTQPASVEIGGGTAATLTVAATGEGLLYQWYRGESGDTSSPVEGAIDPTFLSAPLYQTASFWVKVRNGCGSVDSDTAVVSVRRGKVRAVRR